MKPSSLSFVRRSPRHRRRAAVPPAAGGLSGWPGRLRGRILTSALAGALVPAGAWAVHSAGALAWPWTAAGVVAGGAGLVLLSGHQARSETGGLARLVAEQNAAARAIEAARAREAADAWAGRYLEALGAARAQIHTALGLPAPGPFSTRGGQARFEQVEAALEVVGREAVGAVAQTLREGASGRGGAAGRETQVVASIAPRMHSTITQLLEVLERLENTIEEPPLLRVTFRAELLATLARRYCESLMVLGGKSFAASRDAVPLGTVVRQATAETEHYRRAETLWPLDQELWLVGYAGPGVTHLLAALIDNALRCSPPDTKVEVRAERRPQGLEIEIEDRGLSMLPQALAEANTLLADPRDALVLQLLRGGQTGLAVVARLAAAYGISVVLRAKRAPEQGIIATVLVPNALVVTRTQLAPAARPPHAAPPSPQRGRTRGPRPSQPAPAPEQAAGRAAKSPDGTRPALPRRGSGTEPAAGAVQPAVPEVPSAAGGRPALARRTRTPHPAPAPGRGGELSPAPDTGLPAAGAASSSLAGAFLAGARAAASLPEPGTGSPPPADPGHTGRGDAAADGHPPRT